MTDQATLDVGQVVRHRLFDYRGVICDVDPVFMHSEEWYDQMAKTQPPKDEPWYRVLVHDSPMETYVAQRNLEPDESHEPVNHPEVAHYFMDFDGQRYRLAQRIN